MTTELKENIIKLIADGKSTKEITAQLGCTASNVSYFKYRKYHTLKYFQERHFKIKNISIQYLGGCCQLCGYDKCINAIDFHHIDPTEKEYDLSKIMKHFDKLQPELDKCVVLCATCHREVHAGLHPDVIFKKCEPTAEFYTLLSASRKPKLTILGRVRNTKGITKEMILSVLGTKPIIHICADLKVSNPYFNKLCKKYEIDKNGACGEN